MRCFTCQVTMTFKASGTLQLHWGQTWYGDDDIHSCTHSYTTSYHALQQLLYMYIRIYKVPV